MDSGQAFDFRVAAIWIGIILLGLLAGVALWATSGIYNVAASHGHFAVTHRLLEFGMRRSVDTHSLLIEAPPLDDPDLVRLGAGHFHGGCATCHGSPSERSNPIFDQMLPSPPPLRTVVGTWSDPELFWIVRNGIKYTGMPSWVALDRTDEVWAVVAFLRAMPGMSADEYRRLVRTAGERTDRTSGEIVQSGAGATGIATCARCHGTESLLPVSRLVPVLAGQSAKYLERSLRNYSEGTRKSGIMQPVASELAPEAISELARYYEKLPVARKPPRTKHSVERIQRGQEIATLGIPSRDVPPCLACHAGSTPGFPVLAGQHTPYIVSQLRLWRHGQRAGTPYGAIMAPIGQRLTAEQAEDVAAFFESLGGAAVGGDRPPGERASEAPP